MMTPYIIPEIDILISVAHFLIGRNVKPYQFSVARGKGIDHNLSYDRIVGEIVLHYLIKPVSFENKGPDIIGVSQDEWWQIECKGSGEGKSSTQRNNFDRALASVVSYYTDHTDQLPKEYKDYSNARPYLGLALPSSFKYMDELKRRVRQPLRKALNLWVLLYEPESKKIKAVYPDHNY